MINMDNELIVNKNWWSKNWKWFLPTSVLLFLLFLGFILSSNNGGNVTDIAQAYTDDSLYNNAFEKAKTNKRVLELLGEIKPIDKLAILEGNAVYSSDNNFVKSSVRIKGNKGKGKMDIWAIKSGIQWKYKTITIRVKNPKEEILIIKDTVLDL
jgi:hypothetical protein